MARKKREIVFTVERPATETFAAVVRWAYAGQFDIHESREGDGYLELRKKIHAFHFWALLIRIRPESESSARCEVELLATSSLGRALVTPNFLHKAVRPFPSLVEGLKKSIMADKYGAQIVSSAHIGASGDSDGTKRRSTGAGYIAFTGILFAVLYFLWHVGNGINEAGRESGLIGELVTEGVAKEKYGEATVTAAKVITQVVNTAQEASDALHGTQETQATEAEWNALERFENALKNYDIEEMRFILSEHARLVNGLPSDDNHVGYRPLLHAILRTPSKDDVQADAVLMFLLEHGANVNVCFDDGNTALHYLADALNGKVNNYDYDKKVRTVYMQRLTILKEHGADINARNKSGKDTARMISGVGLVSYTEPGGRTAFHLNQGQDDVIKWFLDAGADPNAQDDEGNTPLHIQVKYGGPSLEGARLMVEHGANLQLKNKAGERAIDKSPPNATIKYLRDVANAGNDSTLPDKDSLAKHATEELSEAVIEGDLEKVTKLLNLGAKPRVLDEADKSCLTEIVSGTVADEDVEFQIAKLLIEKGASPNATNKGLSPVEVVVANFNVSQNSKDVKFRWLKFLVENGATVKGTFALHQAIENEHVDSVRYLLEHGMDVNLRDKLGRTPLHYAVQHTNGIVDLLVSQGAEINAVDASGSTPADLDSGGDLNKYHGKKSAELSPEEREQGTAVSLPANNNPPDQPETNETETGVYAHVKGDAVRVRSKPSTDGEVLDKLNTGDKIKVIGRDPASAPWLKIQSSDGTGDGWIHGDFVTFD